MTTTLTKIIAVGALFAASVCAGQTTLTIENGRWHLDGKVTYPGAPAEGLLMNVRMVNAAFEDRNKPDFNPETNTKNFLSKLDDYYSHGVRAFTLCLQGGMPGYEGAVNSAYNPDGSLRDEYLARVAKVINECDRRGIAVILGCYYQRQDQILKDPDAVRRGVVNTVNWITRNEWKHVSLEIANEYDHNGFDHEIIRTADGEIELIQLAKKTAPSLLVSTSGLGHGRMDPKISAVADFILPHFNGTPLDQIPGRIAALKRFNKPIVVNEDDKVGETAARAAQLSVEHGASWGLMLKEVNQYFPLRFEGAADDRIVYARLKELTTPRKQNKIQNQR
jgi:hypothetical protein